METEEVNVTHGKPMNKLPSSVPPSKINMEGPKSAHSGDRIQNSEGISTVTSGAHLLGKVVLDTALFEKRRNSAPQKAHMKY